MDVISEGIVNGMSMLHYLHMKWRKSKSSFFHLFFFCCDWFLIKISSVLSTTFHFLYVPFIKHTNRGICQLIPSPVAHLKWNRQRNEEKREIWFFVVQKSIRKIRSNRNRGTQNLIIWNGNGIYCGKTIRSTRKFSVIIIMGRHVNRTEVYSIHSSGLCPDLPTFCRLRAFHNFHPFCWTIQRKVLLLSSISWIPTCAMQMFNKLVQLRHKQQK